MNQKYQKNKKSITIWAVALSALLVILFLISMCVGRYSVSIKEIWQIFTGQSVSDVSYRVIMNLRLPRTLMAMLIGAALSVAGVIYQSAFNNKLVSPDLLGVSSGASVGACFAILLGVSTVFIGLFSFIMGFIAVALTVIIAKIFRNKSNVILLLSGIAVGGLMSSFVGLMKYLADNEMQLAEMTYWLLGSVADTTMNDIFVMLPITAVGCITAIILSWQLNIVSLGEKESKALGVNYKVVMSVLIVVSTLLTAGAVSFSGTIGWVGLVVPNIVRLIVGSDNRKVIPVSMLTGACMMVLVDMLARSLAPNEIPLSIITGIIGTPLFIFSIFRRRKEIR